MIGAAHAGVIAAATPRGPVGGEGHLHWRLYWPNDALQYNEVGGLEMYDELGGANVCTGGTPYASSSFSGYPVTNAFDGSATTAWAPGDNNVPCWLAYEFASPKAIVQAKVIKSSGGNTPGPFKIQWSDDGENWTDASPLLAVRRWLSTGVAQKFAVGFDLKSYWRIYVTANNGSGYTTISEVELRGSVGGADLTEPSGASRDDSNFGGFDSTYAFNNSTADYWVSSGGLPHWIWYAFGEHVDVAEVSMRNWSNTSESPGNFKIQSSPDGFTWTDELTVTGETWSSNQTKTYTI